MGYVLIIGFVAFIAYMLISAERMHMKAEKQQKNKDSQI